MSKPPSTLSPLEAYEALMLFAQRRGEGALRLALHAAVPQGFRPDLLHLLKLNFLPRELHEPAAEADVLFSPLCEETGRGYFEFGPHVRTLLLDNLASSYAADRTPRIRRVANFLLHYVEHMERRAAGGLDRLLRDHLEVQRWVALAFLDPDDAARQLAAALKGTTAPGAEFAARLRLGGLASALASPLVRYRHVLNYAAGLQALEAGDHERARTLLSGLGDEELEVGGVRLRPAAELLRDYGVRPPEPPPEPEKTSAPEPPEPPQSYVRHRRAYISYSSADRAEVLKRVQVLQQAGVEVFMDALSLRPGEKWEEAIQTGMREADVFYVFLSRRSTESKHVLKEIDYALRLAAERPEGDFLIKPVRLEPCEIPRQLAMYHVTDLPLTDEGSSQATEQLEREEKIRTLEALAGSDEPHVLETLTEAVWREEDSRVRLAAVKALSKSRSETALEALLTAAGDEDADVRRAAAEALAGAGVNAVLIFGFFGTDHVENREVLREGLRRRGYVPLVFPFARPPIGNTADIARAAAHFTRFAIADLTAPPEILEDLGETLDVFLSQTGLSLLPIHQGVLLSKLPVELRRQHPSVLPLHSYSGPAELRESFDRAVMEPALSGQRDAEGGGAADDFDALYKGASRLEAAGHLEQALGSYVQAERAAGQNTRNKFSARAGRADLLAKMGRLEEALKAYDEAIQIISDDEDVHLGRSQTLEIMGRYEAAVADYRFTAGIAQRSDKLGVARLALLGQARSLINLSHFEEALTTLGECRRLMEVRGDKGDAAELLYHTGVALTELSRPEEARKQFEQSLSAYRELDNRRGEARALKGLGRTMWLMRDIERAVPTYEESLRMSLELGEERHAAEVLISLGGVLVEGGRYSEAENALTRALNISSKVSDRYGEAAALTSLGALYSTSGRFAAALEAYDRALAVVPDNEAAINGRAEVLKRMPA